MAVLGFVRRIDDLDQVVHPVDQYDYIPFGFALQLQRIKARKLEKRAEETANVTVYYGIGLRGD
jgi:hypothetical protein